MENGQWKTLRAGRTGPYVSHLLFADDILLFEEASLEQINCMMDYLNKFCNFTGQKVSKEKTRIYFSKRISDSMANQIILVSSFTRTDDLGVYLGMPL